MKIFICLSFCFGLLLGLSAQNDANNISDIKIERYYSLLRYYKIQQFKDYHPEKYKKYFNNEFQKIQEIVNAINHSESEDILLLNEIELEMYSDLPPESYLGNELSALNFSLSLSYLGLSFAPPVFLQVEKILHPNIGIGMNIGTFQEHNAVEITKEENGFYKVYSDVYNYRYYSINSVFSYHFILPGILDYIKWDTYVTALLGYNMASEIKTVVNTEVSGFKPQNSGLSYGLLGGLRYMIDENMGIFTEFGYSNTGYLSAGFSYRFLPLTEYQKEIKKQKKERAKIKETEVMIDTDTNDDMEDGNSSENDSEPEMINNQEE